MGNEIVNRGILMISSPFMTNQLKRRQKRTAVAIQFSKYSFVPDFRDNQKRT